MSRSSHWLHALTGLTLLTTLITSRSSVAIAQTCSTDELGQAPECAGITEQPSTPTVVVAVGDIACPPDDSDFNGGNGTEQRCRQSATAALAAAAQPQAVLLLGDLQYPNGSLERFKASFDRSWGALLPITHPVPGNHEYETKGAAGYFDYFGPQASDRKTGYYSLDIGSWHVVALNSNCDQVGGCRESSPQGQWLQNDLSNNSRACTLAYWHHPRFSSSEHGSDSDLAPFWRILYSAGAEIVLNGHDHVYERFAPQNPRGEPDPTYGLVQMTVGTGGRSLYTFESSLANSEVRLSRFGDLVLRLLPTTAEWHFLTADGAEELDSGFVPCHPAPSNGG